jgi:spore photoproduct lyase
MTEGAKRLWIEAGLEETPLGKKLAGRMPVAGIRERIPPAEYSGFGSGDLVLARHQGAMVKPCPGTRGYLCCGLEIVHFGLGCSLGCSYCILQGYLNTDALVLFGNVAEGLAGLEAELARPWDRPRRFCSGEFTDSLLLEPLTGLGRNLVKLFARSRHHLELKSKTVNIHGLLDLDHNGRTILSFSVNAAFVARTEEPKAAPLERRIEAAAMAVQAGYRVGFHFDPMIRFPGWEDEYRRTVDAIYQSVPGNRIAWISLGAFRYLPGLETVIRARHPHTRILGQEFIQAGDGKRRYPRPLRVEMYSHLLHAIRSADPSVCVYLCMESPRVWRESYGFTPGPDDLIKMLDQRVNG